MKKIVDWDKMEEETDCAEEVCECTISKLQSMIDCIKKRGLRFLSTPSSFEGPIRSTLAGFWNPLKPTSKG
jgi:hypothetical protein